MFNRQSENAAEKVAFGFITRQLDPVLKEPVEGFLAQGWGVAEFGATNLILVREGWFGERRMQLRVDEQGHCQIIRL